MTSTANPHSVPPWALSDENQKRARAGSFSSFRSSGIVGHSTYPGGR
ncbi:MAG TPA: hypothetical protein VIE44_03095 [Methylomirabilota bacterium]